MKHFLIILSDKQSVLMNDRLLCDHINHLKNLHADGYLPICGPFTDNTGAVLIVKTDSQDHAEQMIRDDPFIKEKYYKNFAIHEFIAASDENCWLAESSQTLGNLKIKKNAQ